jgi:hypothetical protein
VRGAEARSHPEAVERSFLREAALGVAGILPEDLERGILTVPLGVSTWMARSEVDLSQACDLLLELRFAFLAVSGLDQRTEPVPLLGGDRRTSVLTLAVYLDGLVERGARASGITRTELAQAALAVLDP